MGTLPSMTSCGQLPIAYRDFHSIAEVVEDEGTPENTKEENSPESIVDSSASTADSSASSICMNSSETIVTPTSEGSVTSSSSPVCFYDDKVSDDVTNVHEDTLSNRCYDDVTVYNDVTTNVANNNNNIDFQVKSDLESSATDAVDDVTSDTCDVHTRDDDEDDSVTVVPTTNHVTSPLSTTCRLELNKNCCKKETTRVAPSLTSSAASEVTSSSSTITEK